MDMNNVKSIYDNSVGKEVKKIQDSNGNVIWRKNLFLGFNSPWCCNFSISIANGNMASNGGERTTYFFKVKPNTTYRYTAITSGDRFAVYTLTVEHDTPPSYQREQIPYNDTVVNIIKNNNYDASITDYTFTTGPNDKMVYIYFALNTKPTGVRIVEV